MKGEPVQRRRYSHWAAGWTFRGLNPGRNNRSLFSSPKCPNRPWGPHSVPFNGHRCTSPEKKRPGHEVCHLTSTNVEVKNEWICTSSPAICLHGVDGGIFTFTCVSFRAFTAYIVQLIAFWIFDIRDVSRCQFTNPHGVQTQQGDREVYVCFNPYPGNVENMASC